MALTELWEVGFPKRVSKTELGGLLMAKYPEHKWDMSFLLRGKFAQQKRLEREVRALFMVTFYLSICE